VVLLCTDVRPDMLYQSMLLRLISPVILSLSISILIIWALVDLCDYLALRLCEDNRMLEQATCELQITNSIVDCCSMMCGSLGIGVRRLV
jgi:hypothetical protein